MADQSDVEAVLVAIAAAALYPNGVAALSAVGPVCRIYRGWPTAAALDSDLAAGRVNVTVFPVETGTRTTTRYPDIWFPIASTPATLAVSISDVTATFSGTPAAGQVAGLRVDDRTVAYRVQDGDTVAAVAANLGALLRPDLPVSVSGNSVSVPGVGTLLGRVVADTTAMREVRRQVRDFRITCWCPTPALRDATAASIDLAFADMRFVDFPDGATGRLSFAGSTVFDQSENATLYRRDLVYSVEYPTILTDIQPAMLFGNGTVSGVSFIG